MSQQSNYDKVVRNSCIKRIGNSNIRALSLCVDDSVVVLQLLKPWRFGPRDRGDIVTSGASQLEGKSAAYVAGTKDGYTQQWSGGHA